MKNYSILFLLLLLSGNLLALSNKEYLEKINANYANLVSFELELDYKLYKGHFGNEIKDEYASIFRMDGKKSYRKFYSEEIITTAENTVVLNHDLKTIQISAPITDQIIDPEIEKSLSLCQDIIIKEHELGKMITITFKKFSSITYSRIDLIIDEDFWVKNMVLYYATQIDYSNDFFNPDLDYPRLEIAYTSLKKRWKDKQGLTDVSKYFVKNGETYQTTDLYQTYQIIK